MILHVQSNFFMETFNYVVMSKGIILLAGQENMQNTIRTFAITLSAEMAPVATVVVYNIDRRSEVVADSLTFPVNGVSRNNVNTLYIILNNCYFSYFKCCHYFLSVNLQLSLAILSNLKETIMLHKVMIVTTSTLCLDIIFYLYNLKILSPYT